MSQPSQQFVVDTLRPEGFHGSRGGVYQLNAASVTPERMAGSDELGMPIMERVPIAYSRPFVGLDGCTKMVPLRTAAVFSNAPEAERYQQIVLRDIIRGGQLPLDKCPYTNEYAFIKGGPLVKPPAGKDDCGGKVGGCEHMLEVIKARQAKAKAAWDKDQEQLRNMKPEDAERLVALVADGVGQAIARNADPKANRKNLATGHGEKD